MLCVPLGAGRAEAWCEMDAFVASLTHPLLECAERESIEEVRTRRLFVYTRAAFLSFVFSSFFAPSSSLSLITFSFVKVYGPAREEVFPASGGLEATLDCY